ncbi:MAG: hypothetical protein IPP78_08400 [Holophagaceae bacterium]|nr:hypothetical protein [Holophagaceae bacterium]
MSTHAIPSPFQTMQAVARGYLPRVMQVRGWVLAAIPVVPVLLSLALTALLRIKGEHIPSALYLMVFHGVLAKFMLPIMALVAAPAGIREDIEQRTIPLMLARPSTVWMLPFGKGLLWFGWGAVWLVVACTGLLGLGSGPEDFLYQAAAMVSAYWAILAFMSLLGLVFKRGTLWGALYLFIWDPLVRIFPGNLQRITFVHYIESISGTRSGDVAASQLLAQEQITTPVGLAILVLLVFGLVCWALCGWKLQATPMGLAGSESEG